MPSPWRQLAALSAHDWSLLLRPRLLVMVCCSALVGAILSSGSAPLSEALRAMLAVGLLTAGSTLLNQWQERDIDALMERTSVRPIACGKLSSPAIFLLIASLLSAGLALLAHSPIAAGLGCLAVLWYNGVYTPMKRLSSLAVLPGALCGALPPLIGWSLAGGSLLDHRVLLLAGLLTVWQVPHFLLLVLRYREDYQRAGLPVLAEKLSDAAVIRVIVTWTLAAALGALVLALFGPVKGWLGQLLLPACGSWLLLVLWRQSRQGSLAPLFVRINMFMGLVLAALLTDHLFG